MNAGSNYEQVVVIKFGYLREQLCTHKDYDVLKVQSTRLKYGSKNL
jgi:hypothetical protein